MHTLLAESLQTASSVQQFQAELPEFTVSGIVNEDFLFLAIVFNIKKVKIITSQSKLSILTGMMLSATLKPPINRAKKTICCSSVYLMFSAYIKLIGLVHIVIISFISDRN